MTWIETISPAQADDSLAKAYAMQRTLYPAMYGASDVVRVGRLIRFAEKLKAVDRIERMS